MHESGVMMCSWKQCLVFLFTVASLTMSITLVPAFAEPNVSVSKTRPQAEQIKLKMKIKIDNVKQDKIVTQQLKEIQKTNTEQLRKLKSNNTSPAEALKFNDSFMSKAMTLKKQEIARQDYLAKVKALKTDDLLQKLSKFKDANPSGKKIIMKDLGKNKTCDVRCQLGK